MTDEARTVGTRRRAGWSVWLGGLSLFVLGAVSGVLFERLHDPAPHRINGGAGDHRDVALEHLRSQLHLDGEQERAVDSALQRHQVLVDEAWSRLRPEVQAAIDSVHAHILTVLRPDQIEAFHRLLSEQEDRHRDPP